MSDQSCSDQGFAGQDFRWGFHDPRKLGLSLVTHHESLITNYGRRCTGMNRKSMDVKKSRFCVVLQLFLCYDINGEPPIPITWDRSEHLSRTRDISISGRSGCWLLKKFLDRTAVFLPFRMPEVGEYHGRKSTTSPASS